MDKKTYYITTPIYFPSGNPHIGHCYTTVACDAIARYKRFQGYDVMFSTGTDEHGMKIEENAKKAGISPKEFVDAFALKFQNLWKYMNISYDRYIRTTDDGHIEAVQKIFKELYDMGYIYKGEYSGKYCVPCEAFWTETQLKDGKCPDCSRDVKESKEEAYFLKMEPFAKDIEKLLTETDFLKPETRVREMYNNFIKPGLEDLCVSRTSFSWGVPVSFDNKHIVYVWIDALSNYITLLGYKNDKFDGFDKYWPANLHMTGNEIVRFHSIIWPALLIALKLPFPKRLYSHGWIIFDGQKMSKSRGNVIDPFIIGERYGVDSIRYFLLRDMPYSSDMNFSNETMITRINSDLANDFGNLVSRTVAMADKYFGGTLPSEKITGKEDSELISMASGLSERVDKLMDEPQLSAALTEIFKVVSRANKYIDETTPWILAKDEKNLPRLASVIYNLLESIRITSLLLHPFMPNSMSKVWFQIGAVKEELTYESVGVWGSLKPNVTVQKGEIIFPRYDLEKELKDLLDISNEGTSKTTENTENITPYNSETIKIEDFKKVDMRTGTVLECEKVKKSSKLLKLIIDDGTGKRQIVSGIAKWYSPDDLIGKKIVFVANLAPVKLCGHTSEGMVLTAGDDKNLTVLFVDDNISNSSKIN